MKPNVGQRVLLNGMPGTVLKKSRLPGMWVVQLDAPVVQGNFAVMRTMQHVTAVGRELQPIVIVKSSMIESE